MIGAASRSAAAGRRAVGDVLIACAAGTDPRNALNQCSAEALGLLPAAAEYHGISMLVHSALRRIGFEDTTVADALTSTFRSYVGTSMRTAHDQLVVRTALNGAGLAWAILKGPMLSEIYYGDASARSSTDLDVLVDPRDLGAALDVLADAGAQLIDVNWDLIRKTRRGELNLRLPMGTPLDLHWTLVNEASVRRCFNLPSSRLLERRVTHQLTAGESPSLDQTDTLVHVALHACLSGGHRLGWLTDVARVVEHGDLDWEEVVERGQQAGAGLPVAVMVERARRVLGLRVPAHVLKRLGSRSPGWIRFLRVIEGAHHYPPVGRYRFSGRAVTGATRSALFDSSRAALRLIADRYPLGPSVNAAGNPLHYPFGNETDRSSFLQEIIVDDERAQTAVHGWSRPARAH